MPGVRLSSNNFQTVCIWMCFWFFFFPSWYGPSFVTSSVLDFYHWHWLLQLNCFRLFCCLWLLSGFGEFSENQHFKALPFSLWFCSFFMRPFSQRAVVFLKVWRDLPGNGGSMKASFH